MSRILPGFILLLAACASSEPAPAGALKIHGPFVHEHLALYVVEDPSAKSAGEFITLAEGLSSGEVKVSEKKNAEVQELLIENSSGRPCFVQAGDVVKGGQQDRTIARDFVIPAKTAPTPVAAFCVEQARWEGGKALFGATTLNAYGKDLKLAVQGKSDQGEVWKEVAKNKRYLAGANDLAAPQSTSLNEELDNKKIQERMKAYKDALTKVLENRPQAVGLIAAVNGKFSTADVYADPGLFRKLFPRLLESASLEAISLKAEDKPAPAAGDAAAFLADGEKGTTTKQKIRDGLEANTTDNAKSVRFEYLWQNGSLHRQTLSK